MEIDWASMLPGVPAIELPVPICEPPPHLDSVSREVFVQLRDRGYAVIDFPEPEFEKIVLKIRHTLEERYDWDTWRKTGFTSGDGLRTQDAWQYSPEVRKIATNARVLEILRSVYGRRAFPFQTLNFPVGTQQEPHSDMVHFSSIPERWMVGVWVALEDISEAAGPLCYYEGSHKLPFFHPEQIGSPYHYQKYLELWKSLCTSAGLPLRHFLAKKGQALIWAANLIHGGAKQLDSTLTRWSQVTHYYFDNCLYYTPIHSSVFAGKAHIREPIDITVERKVSGKLFGSPVTPALRQHFEHDLLLGMPAGFSSDKYLELNPDVKAAGIDPVEHYLRYGLAEKRRYI